VQFEVDARSPVSPGDQLADQVRFAVAAGRLAVGERLPSVRDLARSVRLNPNTVSRAWRELELTGVLESRRGSGMYVAHSALAVARSFRTRALAERLGRAVGDALAAGLDTAEVQELVATACAAWGGAGGALLDTGHLDTGHLDTGHRDRGHLDRVRLAAGQLAAGRLEAPQLDSADIDGAPTGTRPDGVLRTGEVSPHTTPTPGGAADGDPIGNSDGTPERLARSASEPRHEREDTP
jgi:GntR family transcriptional regulator